MFVTRKEATAIRIATSDYAESVVFYLVDPAGPDRRLLGRAGQARLKSGLGLIGADPAPQLTR